jgi:hypothetical protein
VIWSHYQCGSVDDEGTILQGYQDREEKGSFKTGTFDYYPCSVACRHVPSIRISHLERMTYSLSNSLVNTLTICKFLLILQPIDNGCFKTHVCLMPAVFSPCVHLPRSMPSTNTPTTSKHSYSVVPPNNSMNEDCRPQKKRRVSQNQSRSNSQLAERPVNAVWTFTIKTMHHF